MIKADFSPSKSKKTHFFEKKSTNILVVQKKAIPLHTSNDNNKKNGLVAQLNRASDYGSEGYRFESCRDHKRNSNEFLFFVVILLYQKDDCSVIHIREQPKHKHKIKHDKTTMQTFTCRTTQVRMPDTGIHISMNCFG